MVKGSRVLCLKGGAHAVKEHEKYLSREGKGIFLSARHMPEREIFIFVSDRRQMKTVTGGFLLSFDIEFYYN
jgi:hypothetical protein